MEPNTSARFLRLGAGFEGWEPAFSTQIRSLQEVISTLFERMRLEPPRLEGVPSTLFVRKIVTGYPKDGEFKTWIINSRGKLERRHARDLVNGDLVDVEVVPEVVLINGTDGLPRTSVFFSFDNVVRLKRADEVARVSISFVGTTTIDYLTISRTPEVLRMVWANG